MLGPMRHIYDMEQELLCRSHDSCVNHRSHNQNPGNSRVVRDNPGHTQLRPHVQFFTCLWVPFQYRALIVSHMI